MGELEQARDERSSSEMLAVLGNSDDPSVRMTVAANPTAPVELLERLAADQWENANGRAGVRQGVAGNPSASAEILSRLAGDADEQVRMAVAGNPSSPPQLLASMADDDWEFYEVRELIAGNPSASTDTLLTLAGLRDDDVDVDVDSGLSAIRGAVASNPIAPVEALCLLAEDSNAFVRVSVASNPATPRQALEHLGKDEDSEVRESAEAALAIRT